MLRLGPKAVRFMRLPGVMVGCLGGWLSPAVAQSLPTAPSVASGNVSFAQPSTGSLTVTQSSAHGIVNWSTFSIGAGNSVSFQNGSGATLNRVTGNVPSSINGLLTATGSVYLVNPAGIAVGPTGVVKTGGSFVGSTLDISNDKFLSGGALTFSGNSTASVVNLGRIGSSRGDVVLMARHVENNGSIRARRGTVGLASGGEVTIRDQAMADGKIAVSLPASGGSVRNSGAIRAASVELAANGGNVYALGVNTRSVIKATGVAASGGRVFLTAKGGSVQVSQKISAQRRIAKGSKEKNGGTIVVTGDAVTLANGAALDASGKSGGTILVGGDRQGGAVAANNFAGFAVANAKTTTVESGVTIKADGSAGNGGNIVVWSDQETSFVGAISARGGATAGNGGFAEVSGHNWLDFNGTADLRAPAGKRGTLLLDPSDITISGGTNSATGSGTNPRTYSSNSNTSILNATTLLTALGTADVVVDASAGSGNGNGDITVDSALTWTSASTLFLHANRNITLNADITATNGGLYLYAGNLHTDFNQPNNLAGTIGTITPNGAINVGTFTMGQGTWVQVGSSLPSFQAGTFQADTNQSFTAQMGADYYYWSPFTSFGQSSGYFVRAKGGDGSSGNPYQLYDAHGLQGIAFSMTTAAYNYKLVNNIDASAISDFRSIGDDDSSGFQGVFDGQNFTISNLKSTGSNNGSAGLFGYSMFGTVRNLKFTDINIGGSNAQYAGLMGRVTTGASVQNVSVTGGAVQSPIEAGGLAAELNGGSISNSNVQNVAVTVTGTFGLNNRLNAAGGLVGAVSSGTITQSYATGTVSGARSAGGLVGYAVGGTISQSYSTGAVTLTVPSGNIGPASSFGAGGFIGVAQQGVSITQSYATGAVTVTNGNSATVSVGGFIGANGGAVNEAHATGYVNLISGNAKVGGFAGAASALTNAVSRTGTLTNVYFDTGTTGRTAQTGDGAATTGGLTTAQLQGTLPAGFNTVASSVWATAAGRYPYFNWRFSSTPDVVTGTAYSANPSNGGVALAGQGVNLLAGGTTLAGGSTGANGYYYIAADNGTVSGAAGILATLTGTTKGNTFSDTLLSAAVSGLDLYGGYLRVVSGGATYSTIISHLSTALGSNSGANYLFGASGSNLTLNNNTNFEVLSSASNLHLDKTITASGTGVVVLNNTVGGTVANLPFGIVAPTLVLRGAGATYSLISASNAVGTLAGSTGSVLLGNGSTSLIIGSAEGSSGLSAGTISLGNSGTASITINDTASATGSLSLTSGSGGLSLGSSSVLSGDEVTLTMSGGGITQASGGRVTASTVLQGSITGDVSLTSTANNVAAIGDITVTSGDFSLVNNGNTGALIVSGTLSAANVSLRNANTGSIAVSGSISATSALTLASGSGGISFGTSGALSAATVDLSASGGGVTQATGASVTASTRLRSTSGVTGDVSLLGSANDVADLGAFAVASGDFSLSNAGRTGTLTISGAVSASNVSIVAGGALTIGAAGSVTAGTNATLVSAGAFTNSGGASAIAATSGRWLVWSQDPANDSRGGLVYGFKQYNATYGVTTPADSTHNGFLYTTAPTITAALGASPTKIYDRTTAANLTAASFNVTGAIDGDTVNITNSGGSFSQANVGTNLTVTVSGLSIASATDGAAAVYGYGLSASSASSNTASITAKPLTITAAKTYDQAASFALGELSLSGIISGDSVSLTGGGASVSSANAGSYSSFAANTLTVSNSNYTASGSGITVAASIAKRGVTLTGSKTYDRSATFAASDVAVSGVLSGDTVTLTGGTVSVSSANAGAYSSFATNTLTTSNGNYAVTGGGVTTSATIGRAGLTLTAATNSKTYDGTTSAAATPTVGGLVSGDTVTGLAETYADKNAGTGKTLSVSAYTINDGNGGNNYAVTTVDNNTGSIARAVLTVAAVADTKGYDATTASAAAPTVSGLKTGDSVTGLSQTFDTASIGTGKTLTVSAFVLNDGNGGGNYNVGVANNNNGNITRQAISVTAANLTKFQGQADPLLAYSITAGALAGGDAFTGALIRAAGEGAGSYAIEQGTLALSANYTLTFVAGRLTIQAAAPTDVFGSFSQTIQQGTQTAFNAASGNTPAVGQAGAGQGSAPGTGPDLGNQNNGAPPPLFCSAGESCARTPFFQNMQYGQWITFNPQ